MIRRILRLPAVLFLLAVIGASAAQAHVPFALGVPSFRFGLAAGIIVLCTATAIAGGALVEMRRHHTTVEPWQKPSSLVTGSVFAFTRNPLYLSLVLVTVALALMADTLWFVIAAAILGVVLDVVVIRPEERMLRQIFADGYASYASRVRRWI